MNAPHDCLQTVRDQFFQFRAKGYSYDRISRVLKVSKHTLLEWGRRYAGTIAELRAVHLESQAERFALLQRQRVLLLGMQLRKVRHELARRDLTEVPTVRLIDLVVKLTRAARAEDLDLMVERTECPDLPLDEADEPTAEASATDAPSAPEAEHPEPSPEPARTKSAPISDFFSTLRDMRDQPGALRRINAKLCEQNRRLARLISPQGASPQGQ